MGDAKTVAVMTESANAPRFNPGPLCLDAGDFRHRLDFLKSQARAVRRWTIAVSGHAGTGQVGPALATVDLLTALYFHTLRVNPVLPTWIERDRFILSRGDVTAALYATLAARGFSRAETLWTYMQNGSLLTAQATATVAGVELSTGVPGHGLPVGVGMALAAKRYQTEYRAFVMLSRADCDEGATWEAALVAARLDLDNLIAVVDEDHADAAGAKHETAHGIALEAQWRSVGWNVKEVDGHDLGAICGGLDHLNLHAGRPGVLIAKTTSGKGVSFMEGRPEWRDPVPSAEDVAKALEELS